ncbi:hypothetical protein H9657_08935 [Cellulomonas sp. Sa3CUA2]|uniref:Lipoprotein n=1 Tax=Cellulomonas avistercoris TaxID=2762242 RepID=A0ABR8QDE5_9CELL|nr:hypothetical protein [Cellulomonas avistercoris]MBD7918400.1 hypothetical protein [Cellulomonas avistercoris]
MTRRRGRLAGAAVVAGLLLVGCGSGGGDATPTAAAPQGDEVIEPVADLAGAERTSFDGVSILVPEGVDAVERELSETTRQITLVEDGAERAMVVLTVTDEDVDDAAVAASAQAARAQVVGSGAFTEESTTTASWEGFGLAHVLRGTLDLAGDERDVTMVTTRDPDGTRIVAVSAEAAAGELDGSTADEVLRSVRVEG